MSSCGVTYQYITFINYQLRNHKTERKNFRFHFVTPIRYRNQTRSKRSLPHGHCWTTTRQSLQVNACMCCFCFIYAVIITYSIVNFRYSKIDNAPDFKPFTLKLCHKNAKKTLIMPNFWKKTRFIAANVYKVCNYCFHILKVINSE